MREAIIISPNEYKNKKWSKALKEKLPKTNISFYSEYEGDFSNYDLAIIDKPDTKAIGRAVNEKTPTISTQQFTEDPDVLRKISEKASENGIGFINSPPLIFSNTFKSAVHTSHDIGNVKHIEVRYCVDAQGDLVWTVGPEILSVIMGFLPSIPDGYSIGMNSETVMKDRQNDDWVNLQLFGYSDDKIELTIHIYISRLFVEQTKEYQVIGESGSFIFNPTHQEVFSKDNNNKKETHVEVDTKTWEYHMLSAFIDDINKPKKGTEPAEWASIPIYITDILSDISEWYDSKPNESNIVN